jgi:hypothetical protein
MLRQRRHGKDEEGLIDERMHHGPLTRDSSSSSLRAAANHRRAALLVVALLLIATFSLYQWQNRENVDLSVFFHCRQIGDTISDDSAPCVYFRPTKWVVDTQQHFTEESMDIRWTMWGKKVNGKEYRFLGRQGISSVSAILMPKVASRSIESLFQDQLSVPLEDRKRLGIKGPRVGTATPSFWQQLAERQESQTSTTDIAFALLRDPVSRFLSSLAQTLSVFMQRKYKSCSELWNPCLESSLTYKELVQCAVDSMKPQDSSAPYYFDQHVVPQAVFLAGTLGNHNVEIAVFHIKDVEYILQAFGMNEQQHMNTREDKVFAPEVLDRFGEELRDARKAKEALDENMIRDICQLYAVDVSLMHHLGFSAGDCDFMKG